jgi:hypothetical protein
LLLIGRTLSIAIGRPPPLVLTRDIPVYAHPIDELEPEPQISEAYRDAALRLVLVLEIAYDFVVQSDRPRMAMQQVGIALGLPSALRASETELALLNQVTRQVFFERGNARP